MNWSTPGQAKRYVRVSLPDTIEYSTGDHLTVLADNPPELVAVTDAPGIDPQLRGCRSTRAAHRVGSSPGPGGQACTNC